MKEEFSAGGVVFQRKNGQIFILVSQHSKHHGWVFPKGHVGDTIVGEKPEEAALREVQEETGVVGKILRPLPLTHYWYVFEGEKRHKTVQYYLMEYVKGTTEDHDFEMQEVEWLPAEKVAEQLTYDGDKKVWQEAEKLLQNM